MVLIDVYGSGTVALGVFMSFYFASSCFYHISISGQYCQFIGEFWKNG
jgi:hypothetical protein